MPREVTVKYVKTVAEAVPPEHQTVGSAGGDLRAVVDGEVSIKPGETKLVPTGLRVEIPEGYVMLIFPRSGLATKMGLTLANSVGVIDSDYRGEVMVALRNMGEEVRYVKNGDRIAQAVIVPYVFPHYQEVDELSDTERGGGGFGHTGI